MAATTPRRSSRLPHTHTPKMSERKKGLFQSRSEASRESLTTHRQLPVLNSESDSDDCDLGIISTLDSSSGDENDQQAPKTPERTIWRETRYQAHRLLKEEYDLKSFIKSPFTLKKYQTRYSCPDSKSTGSVSTPVTPHIQNHPVTPSSTHSCASAHTTSSTSSRARKSLASLIADTESCSSSLKDLNFDTDSGADSKENTPTKSVRRSTRKLNKMTPKLSFKGVLVEQKKNLSPFKQAVVCLTKMDMSILSPTQMLKTPHSTTETISPPKLSHNRRSIFIDESPESTCDSEKSHKRLHYDSMSENEPKPKYLKLDTANAPKARLSLFNTDRLKEILSAKSFYGKSNPELNSNVTAKISNAIDATNTHHRKSFTHSHSQRRKRRPGQINSGVRHRIRKPKIQQKKTYSRGDPKINNLSTNTLNNTASSIESQNNSSMLSQNSSQDMTTEKADPFDKEKQTIDALLSQWTEDEVPESELVHTKPQPDLPCFNSTIIEATNQIFEPVTAVPVTEVHLPLDNEAVIVELGAQDVVMTDPSYEERHGLVPESGEFLPVEGGYILVENGVSDTPAQEELPDLDEIERELRMLDEQILKMAESNNINANAMLASTDTVTVTETKSEPIEEKGETPRMFSIFEKPNPGMSTSSSKGADKSKKPILKSASDQYIIDAGQKRFGATQCKECGVIYEIGDPQDEHDHLVHHNASDVLKFNGLKDECIVGKSETGSRCIRIRGGGAGWKKVESLLSRVVHPHLGYNETLPKKAVDYTAYLYVDKKQIIGCLIVEPKLRAYKMIPGDPDCCSVEDFPVVCGISRIWSHKNHRRRGVAARLLDCARASFLYGTILKTEDLAFSAPTAAGKALATSYCGTPNFKVYLD